MPTKRCVGSRCTCVEVLVGLKRDILASPIFPWPWTLSVWLWDVVEIGKYHIYAQADVRQALSREIQSLDSSASALLQSLLKCHHFAATYLPRAQPQKSSYKLPNSWQTYKLTPYHKTPTPPPPCHSQINRFNRPSDPCTAIFESILAASPPNLVLL